MTGSPSLLPQVVVPTCGDPEYLAGAEGVRAPPSLACFAGPSPANLNGHVSPYASSRPCPHTQSQSPSCPTGRPWTHNGEDSWERGSDVSREHSAENVCDGGTRVDVIEEPDDHSQTDPTRSASTHQDSVSWPRCTQDGTHPTLSRMRHEVHHQWSGARVSATSQSGEMHLPETWGRGSVHIGCHNSSTKASAWPIWRGQHGRAQIAARLTR